MVGTPDFKGVFVTDFDGTMTQRDFYQIALERFLPPGAERLWEDYQAGRITHVKALAQMFASIRAPLSEVLNAVADMTLDPRAPEAVRRLRTEGWGVFIASAGCAWYIDLLLRQAGIAWSVEPPWSPGRDGADVTLLANPGTYEEGRGLLMRPPDSSPFLHPDTGTDKAGAVRAALAVTPLVAFAGDGPPDEEPALLVPPERRFARGWLARRFEEKNVRFRPYSSWSEIALRLANAC